MSIVVTGASGHLGRLTVEALLDRGVPAGQIVAGTRDVTAIKDLADRGVTVLTIDFEDPESLASAFQAGDAVLLISSSAVGPDRVRQHAAAIDAAKAAGVALIAYTSIPRGVDNTMLLAADHRETEKLLAASGVPHALLRNSWYLENYTRDLAGTIERGSMVGATDGGRFSVAARKDYAEAAAVVLSTEGHAGKVYELGGDTPVTLADVATAIGRTAGRTVTYQDVEQTQLEQILLQAGLPAPAAAIFADVDRGIKDGELLVTTGDLGRLIGHPATAPDVVFTAAVAELA
jgi:NAD(P)H dehydrogenase (quinone)